MSVSIMPHDDADRLASWLQGNFFRFFSLKNVASKFDGLYTTTTCVYWKSLSLNIVY